MTATLTPSETEPRQKPASRRGDRIFAGLARTAGVTIMLSLAAVFIFLAIEGVDRPQRPRGDVPPGHDFLGYIGPLVLSTILAAVIALIVAVPVRDRHRAVHQPLRAAADRRPGRATSSTCSPPCRRVVFGLWGGRYLADYLQPAHVWMDDHLDFLPFFQPPPSPNGRSLFTAGIVLAIMILPIITAISREVFAQTPRLHEEAALALGATRWEMVRYAVFPYARSGMVSGMMLGLGRALGETMAVAMVLAVTPGGDPQRDRHGEPRRRSPPTSR